MTRTVRPLLVALLLAALAAARPVPAQQPATPDLEARLAAIEKAIDEKRRELGIPGAALAIVQDDRVIYLKGFGLRDVERKLPVTPDTLFAIGSSTKAFTGMAVVMAADDGRLSLDDSPKKHVPSFGLQDPEADAKITIRDLLSHRSGLNRTDLGWYSGVLSRDEVIRAVAAAKPTARLGEKWQYQNVMFLAAGEAAARAEGTTYEKLLETRIFKPLKMASTTLSVKKMQQSKDFSRGYDYNFATKVTRNLPTRDLTTVAPAGAINSSARDMAQWVRLMHGRGVFEGKRLVSEAGFAELVKPQMKVSGPVEYGLGWFLRQWRGRKVVEHGGNIDGFNAQVAFLPEERVGFVLLTNVSASPIGPFAAETIWRNLVDAPDAAGAAPSAAPAGDPQAEAGTYAFPQAGFDVEVAFQNGKLSLAVPGQPTYPLENVGGRRYKLGAPAPEGFFVTFRAAKDSPSSAEAYLEQPHGNFVLPKKVAPASAQAAAGSASYAELIGSYADAAGKSTVEVANLAGKVSLVVPGQPPYALVEKAKDVFSLAGLPEAFEVTVRRAGDGKASGFTIKQPQGNFEFTRVAEAKPEITVEDLMARVARAAGGEQAIRKHISLVTQIEIDLVHQGVTGTGTTWAKAPGMSASETTLTALGKKLGTIRSFFDGAAGGEQVSFAAGETYAGKRLEDVRIASDFYEVLNWKTLYKEVKIKGKQKLGDEEVYVVVKTPERGNPVTDYYSTNSFFLVRRDTIHWSETMNQGIPATTTYSDFRNIDGIIVPFRIVSNTAANGDVVTRIKTARFDVAVPDAVFRAK
jgi:CubicO group peptidase (beta-lactamase class C family)